MLVQESRAALAALSFLTRVPVRADLDAEDMRRAGAYFPAVGAGVGALSGSVARRADSPLALAVQTVVTGALHLDALGDSADGLGVADRERALEIMRDSRIGSFGTAAVCLDLMVKAAALSECEDPARVMAGAGALSRAVAVALAAAMPYARNAGAGQALSQGGAIRSLAALGLAAAISRDFGAMAVAVAVGVGSGVFWRQRLGGVTGDTLGAGIELSETAILLWATR